MVSVSAGGRAGLGLAWLRPLHDTCLAFSVQTYLRWLLRSVASDPSSVPPVS